VELDRVRWKAAALPLSALLADTDGSSCVANAEAAKFKLLQLCKDAGADVPLLQAIAAAGRRLVERQQQQAAGAAAALQHWCLRHAELVLWGQCGPEAAAERDAAFLQLLAVLGLRARCASPTQLAYEVARY
jgi:hypothetical protein